MLRPVFVFSLKFLLCFRWDQQFVTHEKKRMSTAFNSDFGNEFAQLTPEQQAEVLQFMRSVKKDPAKGTPSEELLKFVGTIPHEDLEAMKAAIEEG